MKQAGVKRTAVESHCPILFPTFLMRKQSRETETPRSCSQCSSWSPEAGHTAVWLQNPQFKHHPQLLHKATRGHSSQHLHEEVWDILPSGQGLQASHGLNQGVCSHNVVLGTTGEFVGNADSH